MTTRVVGRGKCPRCGEEGSIVLKDIYNKVYVYVKHGRKWCYLGPLEAFDLSSVIISLSDYHYFTTKINEYATRSLGLRSMRTSVLVFVSVFSIAVAYVASASYGYPYEVRVLAGLISQFFAVLAVFTALLAIALYEVKYKHRFEVKIPIVTGNPVLGLLFAVLVTYVAIMVFMPLRSHVEDYVVSIVTGVHDSMIVSWIELRFSLSSLLLSSLVLTAVSKGLFGKTRWIATSLLISPYAAAFALLFTAVAISEQFAPTAIAYLLGLATMVGIPITLLGALYILGIHVFKKILQLEWS